MKLIRNGSQPSGRGAEAYFTGNVRIDSPFLPRAYPTNYGLARITGL